MKNTSEKLYKVSAFYKFVALPKSELEALKTQIEDKAKSLKVRGLFLLGTEGANATVSGPHEGVQEFREFLKNETQIGEIIYKDSLCNYIPFRAFKLKIKNEIVTIGDTEIIPKSSHWNHITPQEWEDVLKNDPDAIVLDTRNWYETEIGKFKKAIDMHINEFGEFPEKLKTLDLPKDKKVLIYCTGGIRCEKAILEMQKQGFDKVYQLEGGILKYFEDVKNSEEWNGECFVFDRRVAVDTNLNPSENYTFCPHCGQPAYDDVDCNRCGKVQKICKKCIETKAPELQTCSKNCQHHAKLGSKVKKKDQGLTRQQRHERWVE